MILKSPLRLKADRERRNCYPGITIPARRRWPCRVMSNRSASRAFEVNVHRADVERAFAHLVMDDETLRQFGTALNSGSSVFLYGPAGVGKTTMAETLSRVLAEDEVWIPYAVEVDGEIITVYDPAIHNRVAELEPESRDERWVLCHRPAVLVGGELTAEMLDLQFNPNTKYYVGPVQMKANNGVLIIDDFGRQRLRPDELLNRWVVPLDRRIDFLTLAGGKKIEMPFEMLVVFATNMDPAEAGGSRFFAQNSNQDQDRRGFRRAVLRDFPPRGGRASGRISTPAYPTI